MRQSKEWQYEGLGSVKIKSGLFVNKVEDDRSIKSLLGEFVARLDKIPTLDDPSFTLTLYRNHPIELLKAFVGAGGDTVIVTSSDLRGDKIVFKNGEKRDYLLELGRSVEQELEI